MSPQARFETTAFLSPEIELPLAFGLPQQQALADVMAVAAAGGTSLLPPAAAPAPSPLLTLPALPPQLQQAGLYSYSQLIQPQQIGGPDQQQDQAQAGGEAAEHGDGCCAPLYQLQAPQLQQHLPPLQAHDVAMALVAAQAGRAWGSPPLQPLRVPGGSPHAGVGRLGRRGQLLAGRKRRRSLEEAAGAPASPSSSGGSSSSDGSSSEDEAEDTHGRQNGSYSSDEEEEGSGDGEAAGASESPRGLVGPGRGGTVLPGGVNQASIGQGQQQGGSRREGSRRRKSQQQPNGTGGAGGGRGGRGGGGSSGGAGGGGGRRPGGNKGGPGRGRRAADGKTAKKRRTKKGGENGTGGWLAACGNAGWRCLGGSAACVTWLCGGRWAGWSNTPRGASKGGEPASPAHVQQPVSILELFHFADLKYKGCPLLTPSHVTPPHLPCAAPTEGSKPTRQRRSDPDTLRTHPPHHLPCPEHNRCPRLPISPRPTPPPALPLQRAASPSGSGAPTPTSWSTTTTASSTACAASCRGSGGWVAGACAQRARCLVGACSQLSQLWVGAA